MSNQDFYLKSIEIEGYKSIQKAAIDFQPGLNIIIGANGSGKTNLCNFINYVLSQEIVNPKTIASQKFESFKIVVVDKGITNKLLGLLEGSILKISAWWGSANLEQSYPISIDGLDRIKPQREAFNFLTWYGDLKIPSNESYIIFNVPKETPFITSSVTAEFGRFPGVSFERSSPHELLFITGLLRSLGEKIALLKTDNKQVIKEELNHFFNTYLSSEFKPVIETLANVTTIKNVRINPDFRMVDTEPIKFDGLHFEFEVDGNWVPWKYLSDGTKRLFYIISEMSLNPFFVLIEEPELGIHPHQLHLLMQFINEQSKSKQIILTTHSPQVLDILGPEELDRVIIAEMTEDGTKLSHLNDHQRKKALHYMKTDGFLSDYWLYSDLEKEAI